MPGSVDDASGRGPATAAAGALFDHIYYEVHATVSGVSSPALLYAPGAPPAPWIGWFNEGPSPWCATATAVSLIDDTSASSAEVCVTEDDFEALLGDGEIYCTELGAPDSR